MKKDIERIWNDNINEARIIFKSMKNSQLDVAKLAYEACEVRQGGNSKDSLFTIVNFANEIGVNSKTLNNWVILYRNVYLKLNDENKARSVYSDLKNIAAKVNSKSDEAFVNRVANEILSISDNDSIVIRYCYDLRAIANSLEKRSVFELAKKENVEEFKFYVETLYHKISLRFPELMPKNNKILSIASNGHSSVSKDGNIAGSDTVKTLFSKKDEKIYKFIIRANKASQGAINKNFEKWRYASLNKLVKHGLIIKDKDAYKRSDYESHSK